MTPTQPTLEEPRTQALAKDKTMEQKGLMKLVPMDSPATVPMDDPTQFVGSLMKSVLERGITQESVGAVRELVGLFEKMDAKRAEQKFNAAFVQLQAEMPAIVAETIIPNRGKYARFEDVWRQVSPFLTKNGFAVSFNQRQDGKLIYEVFTLMHSGGHSRSNEFAVRTGGKSDSETQADCKASTTAKRNAMLNGLNIVIRQDCFTAENDPSSEGEKITKEKAAEIRNRVANVRPRPDKFLQWAGAKTFEEIMSGRLPEIEAWLSKAEIEALK